MTKRIFKGISCVTLTVAVACLFVILSILYDYFSDLQKKQLTEQADFTAQVIAQTGTDFLQNIQTEDMRLTLIDADGNVLFDSKADVSGMENHSDRKEFKEALANGTGESRRTSATLMTLQYYIAKKLPDGNVLRLSASQFTVVAFLLLMLQPILIVLILAVTLSLLLASHLSKQIVKPLNAINLDAPLSNDTYDELSPLLTRIERQHREIERQSQILLRKRNELDAVINNMNEGLVLLNENGTILSINQSAMRLFETDHHCIGQDMLTVNRSLSLQTLFHKAVSGDAGKITQSFFEAEYELHASPVMTGTTVSGVVLFLFDITERSRAEQMRREFTANVSHELKTPLHSICGCAELLYTGLVKPEDIKHFSGQIYEETKRMICLVEDIIRLSRLDEGDADMPKSTVDLYALVKDVISQLTSCADSTGITLSLTGDSSCIEGIPVLLRELLYNLCDNAIKYNRTGGSVAVDIQNLKKSVILTVADTGIGIPEEDKSRIFERFYRVDKSHSKASGGTGLGLSIVKHVALLHNAEINLSSTLSEGTKITVSFPKE